jgi:hypothetical protein
VSYPFNAEKHTQNIVYWDESLPREDSVELLFTDGIIVTSYNGIPVDWGKKPLVFLPPGETVIAMDFNAHGAGSVIFNGNGSFVRNFKAGDRYLIRGWYQNDKGGILFWDMEVNKRIKEMDFYPFPKSGKTVLE